MLTRFDSEAAYNIERRRLLDFGYMAKPTFKRIPRKSLDAWGYFLRGLGIWALFTIVCHMIDLSAFQVHWEISWASALIMGTGLTLVAGLWARSRENFRTACIFWRGNLDMEEFVPLRRYFFHGLMTGLPIAAVWLAYLKFG